MQPQNFARQAPLTGSCEKAADPGAVGRIGMTERVRQDDRALAFPQIAVDLLAVAADVTDEIEHIVGDLQSMPKQIAEQDCDEDLGLGKLRMANRPNGAQNVAERHAGVTGGMWTNEGRFSVSPKAADT